MERKSEKLTEIKVTLKLNEKDIIEYLRSKGEKIPEGVTPSITFQVPSGGDYSGMKLDVDKNSPITVVFKTFE